MDYKREIKKLLDEITDKGILRRIYLIIVTMKKERGWPVRASLFLYKPRHFFIKDSIIFNSSGLLSAIAFTILWAVSLSVALSFPRLIE